MVEAFARKTKLRFKFVYHWLIDHVVLNESVVPNQVLFYILIAFNGLYNAFVVNVPTQILEKSFNDIQYTGFLALVICAPLATIIGKCFRGRYALAGMVMQLAGDVGVFGACTTYVVATIYTSYWGQGNFAGTFVLASALGSTLFILRDGLALIDRDRWVTVDDRGLA